MNPGALGIPGLTDQELWNRDREFLPSDTMIPDLLRAAPQVRPVLDGFGLRG